MKLREIQKLRQQRKDKIYKLKEEKDAIKVSTRYAQEYKFEEMGKINRELEAVRHEYEMEIVKLLEEAERETKQALDKAEFSDLVFGDESKVILREMRNQELTEDLLVTHKGENNETDHEGSLYELAVQQVEDKLSTAPAYIRALRKKGIYGHRELDRKYREATMNPEQKRLTNKLKDIRKEAIAYEADKASESNPLKGALMEYYSDQPEGSFRDIGTAREADQPDNHINVAAQFPRRD